MSRYYTRACNFFYGKISEKLVNSKVTLPLNGNKKISFNQIEILNRKSCKKLFINEVKFLPKDLKKNIKLDLKLITKKKVLRI